MNGSEVQRPMTPLGTARLGAAPLLKASFKLALEFQDRNGQDRNGLNKVPKSGRKVRLFVLALA